MSTGRGQFKIRPIVSVRPKEKIFGNHESKMYAGFVEIEIELKKKNARTRRGEDSTRVISLAGQTKN
jgi:hypothetical protein